MKKKHYINAGFSIVFLAVVLAGTYFSYKKISVIRSETAVKEAEWQEEEGRRAEIKNLERSVKNLAKEKAELDSHFVSKDDPVDFLNSLETMASGVGATAEVSTVGDDSNNSGLVINLNATGSFDSIFRFLTLIENSFYMMEVQNLTLNSGSVDVKTKLPVWTMSLQLRLITFSNI